MAVGVVKIDGCGGHPGEDHGLGDFRAAAAAARGDAGGAQGGDGGEEVRQGDGKGGVQAHVERGGADGPEAEHGFSGGADPVEGGAAGGDAVGEGQSHYVAVEGDGAF